MTSINLLCQHIKFVIWYRLVFPIRCLSRTPNYNKNMMFPLLSYTYENISFRSHHVHSFSHAFCSITFPGTSFPRCWFPPCLPSLSSPGRLPRISCAVHPGTRFQRLLSPVARSRLPLIPVRFRFPQMETGDLDFPVQGRHRSAMPPPTL